MIETFRYNINYPYNYIYKKALLRLQPTGGHDKPLSPKYESRHQSFARYQTVPTHSQCLNTEDASKNSGRANQKKHPTPYCLLFDHWADSRLTLNASFTLWPPHNEDKYSWVSHARSGQRSLHTVSIQPVGWLLLPYSAAVVCSAHSWGGGQ